MSMSTTSRPPFAAITPFDSRRSSPPSIAAPDNSNYNKHHNCREDPSSPTANGNTNIPASFPSPTLTNPDMILPYDGERECSTPSPPFRPLKLPSPEHSGYRCNSIQADNGMHASSGIGVAVSAMANAPHNCPQRNPPPRNNWVFAGHRVRPPLSDIGEESPTRSRWGGDDDADTEVSDMVLGGSPVLKSQWGSSNGELGNDRKRDGNCDPEDCSAEDDDDDDGASCSASSSTISAPSEILDKWEEFRTAGGSRASVTHSKDATEMWNKIHSHESGRASRDFAGMESGKDTDDIRAINEDDGVADDEISSTILSKEAERILENAKKKLTHMEGNLNRARSSLRMTPSPSPLLGAFPLRTRQSTGNMGRSYSITERRAQTSLAGALMRQRVSQDTSTNGLHSRGLSDVSIRSSQSNGGNRDNMQPPIRSFSALGSTNASGFGANDISPKSDRFKLDRYEPKATFKFPVSTVNSVSEISSEPVGNDVSQASYSSLKPDLLPTNVNNNNLEDAPPDSENCIPKISSVEEFNATYPAIVPPRSQSQLQVRGLQDQMQDLKSKVSTLKVQAQEDTLRRRSLQSLRTPSPFTAAEQWYTTAGEYVDIHGKGTEGARTGQNTESHIEVAGQQHGAPVNADSFPGPAAVAESATQSTSDRDLQDDQQSTIDSLYEDAGEEFAYDEDIDRVALAEILNEPLDSPISSDGGMYQDFPTMPTVSETTRHEDREDAFDYEHFFLHSALGNYSRDKARLRNRSVDSTGSVETTRPASETTVYVDSSPQRRQGHVRNNSTDTISTTATFATAAEGADSPDEGYSGDEINDVLYGNGNGSAMKYFNTDNRYRQQFQSSRASAWNTMVSNGSSSSPPLSAASTPRDPNKRFSYKSHNRQQSQEASTRDAAAQLRSPTAMISSLISSAVARYYTPGSEKESIVFDSQLGPDDTKLMETLFQSLGKVALQLQLSSNVDRRSTTDERSSILFRRRLDAARRVLEGQLDV
ncbi:hypothetical protein GX48_02971 [Paracoccidioides brasiliensis]|nr:hypothetical protein GX48_02971 [Paracoccidioides brasiliensis]